MHTQVVLGGQHDTSVPSATRDKAMAAPPVGIARARPKRRGLVHPRSPALAAPCALCVRLVCVAQCNLATRAPTCQATRPRSSRGRRAGGVGAYSEMGIGVDAADQAQGARQRCRRSWRTRCAAGPVVSQRSRILNCAHVDAGRPRCTA